MASERPLPGKCGRKLRFGIGYCAHDPVRGSTRCKLHGGALMGNQPSSPSIYEPPTLSDQTTTGFRNRKGDYDAERPTGMSSYEWRLFKAQQAATGISLEDWRAIPVSSDLSFEIRNQKARIEAIGAAQGAGVEFLYSEPRGGTSTMLSQLDDGAEQSEEVQTGSRVAIALEDMHNKATTLLTRLVKTQHDIRPGGDVAGNFKFTINVGAKGATQDDSVPLLVDDEEEPQSETRPTVRPTKSQSGYEDSEE